jgi:hypothetical protein
MFNRNQNLGAVAPAANGLRGQTSPFMPMQQSAGPIMPVGSDPQMVAPQPMPQAAVMPVPVDPFAGQSTDKFNQQTYW